jgi:hypothetical protein
VVRGILAGRYSIGLLIRERRWATQQLRDLLRRMRSIRARLELLPHALIGPSYRRIAPTDPGARWPGTDAHGTRTSCSLIAADSAVVVPADAPRWTRLRRPATPTPVPGAVVGPSSACRIVTNETSYCPASSRLDRGRRSGLSRFSIEGANSSAICRYLGREER